MEEAEREGPLVEILTEERSQVLRRAMADLPPQMRRCVELRVNQDLKYREIAVLMGVSMYLMQKLTPTTMDPAQQRIMMMMPVIFVVMFHAAPSGLNLYWLASNLCAILQQGITLRLLHTRDEAAARQRRGKPKAGLPAWVRATMPEDARTISPGSSVLPGTNCAAVFVRTRTGGPMLFHSSQPTRSRR